MRRVVKIGGSLLLRPQLSADLTGWFTRNSPAENLVIMGGGELIDAIRKLDAIHVSKNEREEIHWLCVNLLDATHRIMSLMHSDWPMIKTCEELSNAIRTGFAHDRPTLIAVTAFYHRQSDCVLPTDWRTTTDAIAGYLADLVDADECVLLKSCDVAPNATLEELIREGIIDPAMQFVEADRRRLRVEKLLAGVK